MRGQRTTIRDALLFWRRSGKPGHEQAGGVSGIDEQCFRDLAELAFEGVAVVERGRIVEANRAFASTFGYEPSAVAGKTLVEFVDPESRGLVEKSISADREEPYEAVGLKSDGAPLNVEIRARRTSYKNRAVHLVAVRDVTGRREAGERLGQAEARYRALVEQIPAVTYTQDSKAEHHFASLYLSPQAERMFGYKPEEFSSDPGLWVRLIHPEDRERVLAEDARTDETGEFFEAAYRLVTRDGRVLWVCDEATLVSDEEGRPLYWQGVLTDVTARKRAEETLKESEQRFRSLVQNSSDIITLVGTDGTVRHVSPAVERVLGYRPEEVVGRSAFELVHPDDVENARRLFAERLRDPGVTSSIALRMRHRDGSWRHIETIGTNRLDDPGVDAVVLNSRDVTERELAEEALKESERRYAHLLSNTNAYVYRCLNEPGWPNEFASDYALQLTGYKPEDLLVGGTVRFGDLIVEEDRQRVWDEVQPALERRERFKIRYTIRHRDGTLRHVEEHGRGVYDQEGDVEAIEGIVYDVTERKQAEEKIKEIEARYRVLVEQIPAVTYIHQTGETNHTTYISPQTETILGYKPEEYTSDPDHWIKIMHPADRERVLAEDRRTDETGEPFKVEYRQFARDGRMVWVREEAVLVHEEEERSPGYWLGVQYDITEQKLAQEAFKESELRLRAVISNAPIVLFALDHTATVTLSEGKGLSFLGLEPGELVGRSISEVYGDMPEILEDVDRALNGEEFSAVREVGSGTFETWYSPLRASTSEITGVIGVSINITERREAERRLQEAEARYRTLVEQIPAVVYIQEIGHQGAITYISPQIEDVMGYTVHEYLQKPDLWIDTTYPEDRVRVLAEDRRADRTEEPFRMEFRKVRRDGRVIWVRDEATLVKDAEGRRLYWQGIFTDITERKRAEESLRENEAGLAEAQRIAHLGNWEWDVVADELRWSDEVFRIYGFAPKAFVPTIEHLFEVVHPEDRERLKEAIDGALYRGEPYNFEHRIVRPDGEQRVVHRHAEVVRDEDGEPLKMIGTVHDITERKHAEEDIKEANRRLEELAHLRAEFTAMVAHEIGSPLGSIRGFLEVLATGELGAAGRANALAKIQAEIDRLSTLAADIRSAAAVEQGGFDLMLRQTPVRELLEDAAAFAETLPGDHPLAVEAIADGQVRADPYRIGQVLRNLLSNAAKYSPDGAPIELRTAPGETPGRIRIEVGDHGRGVHPDDAARIFEKFGRGRHRSDNMSYGVGLGLYVSRRIVRAHGSELVLDPAPGGGSVFSFELETQ